MANISIQINTTFKKKKKIVTHLWRQVQKALWKRGVVKCQVWMDSGGGDKLAGNLLLRPSVSYYRLPAYVCFLLGQICEPERDKAEETKQSAYVRINLEVTIRE